MPARASVLFLALVLIPACASDEPGKRAPGGVELTPSGEATRSVAGVPAGVRRCYTADEERVCGRLTQHLAVKSRPKEDLFGFSARINADWPDDVPSSRGSAFRSFAERTDHRVLAGPDAPEWANRLRDRHGITVIEPAQYESGSFESLLFSSEAGAAGAFVGQLFFPDGSDRPLVVTDLLFVGLVDNLRNDESALQELAARWNVAVVGPVVGLEEAYLLRKLDQDIDTMELTARLEQEPGVLYAHPNFIHTIEFCGNGWPDDPYVKDQWHLRNQKHEGADIHVEPIWQSTWGSGDVRIAILDSGFEPSHPDIGSQIARGSRNAERGGERNRACYGDALGCNFSVHPPTGDIRASSKIQMRHGQAVAGLAVAAVNGEFVVGVCPGCSLIPIVISTEIDDRVFVAALDYAATRGARVINISWHLPHPSDLVERKLRRLALDTAIIAASGNEPDKQIGFPARSKFVLAVGGSSCRDRRYGNTSYLGYRLDVIAPTSWGRSCDDLVTTSPDGVYSGFGGTSASSGIVAGIAGLLLSEYGTLSPAQLYCVLRKSADPVACSEDEYVDGYSKQCGYGRVNAERASVLATQLDAAGCLARDIHKN